ncbi:MAG: magnesium transporter [Bacteroidia bacterium]|nr:magnesium transporter [Bacteroidia bacterium]
MADQSKNIHRIKAALGGHFDLVKPILKKLHGSDIARILEEVSPESRQMIISILPVQKASEALSEMEEESGAAEILSALSPAQAAELIEELDLDDAADLLAELPVTDLRKILARLPAEDEKMIESLMRYEEDTAGGIMNPDLFKVQGNMTKFEALQAIIQQSEEVEDFYVVYVVDAEDHLQGVVSFKNLLRARADEKVKNLLEEQLISIHVDEDQEDAARLMSQYNLPALPVVDADNRLLGRITFDDILDVLEEESTEDILKIAGVSEDEDLGGSWFRAVRSRIPWLMVNLVTASLAGFVISQFEETIKAMAFITVYMPIIAGVAGNGATQTLAVTIRRIATEGVSPSEYMGVIVKEITVGITNGLLIGLVVSALALFTNTNPILGLVVFLAMTGNLLIAGFAGSSVPLLLERLGVDPAIASSILITAFTDILGYTLLLGLGTALLM